MAIKSLGGGSSAVAASAHAACVRFRGTDPLVIGRTRRRLAADVGFPDNAGRIPEARWMRAMTFERLVRDPRFASEVATTTVGRLGLDRPTTVVTTNANVNANTTAARLTAAHARAVNDNAATLIHALAIPFAGFEGSDTSNVKPDFAVVAPKVEAAESWLIVGDAKDYERVRSRIEDARLLKGFLQVAAGAESADAWSLLPPGMSVHTHGVLAVPRNAFLQPEALVELLDDHRDEVRMRVAERRREAERTPYRKSTGLAHFVAHLQAAFDPASCMTCPLFSYCRNEVRTSGDPADLLIELGIPADVRPQVVGLIDGTGVLPGVPASVAANVTATLDGVAQHTGQRRIDAANRPGTVNVVIVKSDAAALGVHGVALQRVTQKGRKPWQFTVFNDPQSGETRRTVMRLLGGELSKAMSEQRTANESEPDPIHLVVPDKPTADVLISIADNLAGIELSRLRWERDRQMGRRPLTFNGEPARIPRKLTESGRLAVSFLLESDRARALTLRSPVLDLRGALARHVVAGGPSVASYRLDYLVAWAESVGNGPVQPRELEDGITALDHTPGARLSTKRSDAIHLALMGSKTRRRRAGGGPIAPKRYAALVTEELKYKCDIIERTLNVLAELPDSTLCKVYQVIAGDAQQVWRRRLELHASDLVRFGRTYRHWRNSLVPIIERDDLCQSQLAALANPQAASELATDAGTREVAAATVIEADPIALNVDSRRIRDGSRIVLLHVNGDPCVEHSCIDVTVLKGSFKFSGLSIGPLSTVDGDTPRCFVWEPANVPELSVGDELIVADFAWFSTNKRNKFLNVTRPTQDEVSAPTPTCGPDSFVNDRGAHWYCCRPHEDAEAEWSDKLAARRTDRELNPQVWPPVVDDDAFEVAPTGTPTEGMAAEPVTPPPDGVTMDDLE